MPCEHRAAPTDAFVSLNGESLWSRTCPDCRETWVLERNDGPSWAWTLLLVLVIGWIGVMAVVVIAGSVWELLS